MATVDAAGVAFRLFRDIAADLGRGNIVFPTFAAATLKIRTLLSDPEVTTDALAAAIRNEPVMALRLVKLANSAGSRSAGRPITDLKPAIARLGINAVRSAAMTVVMDQLRSMRELRAFQGIADAVWRHSLEVASRAHVLARAFRTGLNPDEALFAGLVHDVGHYYLLSRLGRDPEIQGDMAGLRAIMQEWHPAIGKAVLHDFVLAEDIPDAVAEHESTSYAVPPCTFRDVLCAANHSAAAGNPMPPSPETPPVPEAIATALAEREDELAALRTALRA